MGVSFVQYGGLLEMLTTDKDVYRSGEPVRMSLLTINLTPYPITLTYPTTQRYDFSVTGFSGEVWRWSADRVFGQFTTSIVLAPGQTLFYAETWPQTGFNGSRVMPGMYRVTGWNTFQGFELSPHPSTFIQII